MTHLCAAIFFSDVSQAKRDIAAAREAGADMVELRLDLQPDVALVRGVCASFDLPFILTCRAEFEGGQSTASNESRLSYLRAVGEGLNVYLDFELAGLHDAGTTGESRMIVSAHDFEGRPQRLYNLLDDMGRSGAEIMKVAWAARSVRDNLEAFEILQTRQRPTIAICMGEAGLISRVLAKKFGSFLSFASLGADSATAPGQISIQQMKQLYRWDMINAATKVYGVVGSPIAHSLSPAIHNAAFESLGEDAVYVPLLVNAGYESFKAFMEQFISFEPLQLRGLSVTLPHKENALRYLNEKSATIDPLAEKIGAVNTIIIDRDADGQPHLRGMNTDYGAIVDTVCATLEIEPARLSEKRVAIIGAGGTGRTAVAAMANLGATVVVYNRTKDRADSLAQEFNGHRGKVVSASIEKLCDSCCDIFINTTSVGMHPNINESPFGKKVPAFDSQTLVFDTIYNPSPTLMLKQAAAAGAKTVGGIEMFVRQAATQCEAFTGKKAPMHLMREAIKTSIERAE